MDVQKLTFIAFASLNRRYQTESVPGCDGVGVSKRDYCAFRPPNYLFWVSNGGSGYGLCEGDCDDYADCDQSGPPLKCFQRTGTTQVPGTLYSFPLKLF